MNRGVDENSVVVGIKPRLNIIDQNKKFDFSVITIRAYKGGMYGVTESNHAPRRT